MKNLLFLAAGFFLIYFTSYAQVTHTFQRGYGTAYDDEGISLCEDNNFGYVVAGYTKGYTAGQNMDIYLVHFNSNGNVTWSNYHDDGLNEIGTSILRYNSGDYLDYLFAHFKIWNTPQRVKGSNDGQINFIF